MHKLLVVDDEPKFLKSLSKLFKNDFNVVTASNGDEALSVLSSNGIDCVILDLVMPVMSGIDCLKELRERGNNVPVIVVTGNSCLEYAEDCANYGVKGYINKPYDFEALHIKVTRILSTDRAEISAPTKTGIHNKLIEATTYLDNNFHKQINIGYVSRRVGVSRGYLSNLFKKQLKITFAHYLNMKRVEKAKSLITQTALELSEIRDEVGFTTEQHFFKEFKKHAGKSPKMFRQNQEKLRTLEIIMIS